MKEEGKIQKLAEDLWLEFAEESDGWITTMSYGCFINAIHKALNTPRKNKTLELLPDFLYNDKGIIRIGAHGDSAVTDEWEDYLKKLNKDDIS